MGSDLKYIHKLVLHNTHLTSSVEFGHAVIRLNKCRFFFVVVKVLKFMRFKRYITFVPFLFQDFSKKGHFLDRFKDNFQGLYFLLMIESVHIIQLKDENSPRDHFIFTNSLFGCKSVTFSGSFSFIRCCQFFSVENIFSFQPADQLLLNWTKSSSDIL